MRTEESSTLYGVRRSALKRDDGIPEFVGNPDRFAVFGVNGNVGEITDVTFASLGERIYLRPTSMQTEKSMIEKLRLTTRIVEDQDEALRFYTEKLGLEKKADETFEPDNRWVTVAAERDETAEIVLEPLDWFEDEEADLSLIHI